MSLSRGATPPIPKAGSHWCCTEVMANKLSYTWTIKNFSLCRQQTKEYLHSSIFSLDEHEWRLRLYPKGHNFENKDYLSLFLEPVSCSSEVRAKYELSIVDTWQRKRNTKSNDVRKPPNLMGAREWKEWGFSDFIKRQETLPYLDNDQLTILCVVSIIMGETVRNSNQSKPFKVPECRLSEELGEVFESSSSGDVTLCVGDKEFRVHKVILTARSPVFFAMFEHRMSERKRNRVEIPDVDHEVMGELLRFIYTGRAPNLDKMATELLAAADKYALKRLKVLCEEALCSNLQVDNACEILALADLHSADQLKSRVMDFISSHATAVMDSAGWENIISTYPHLVTEVTRAFKSSSCEPTFKRMKQS